MQQARRPAVGRHRHRRRRRPRACHQLGREHRADVLSCQVSTTATPRRRAASGSRRSVRLHRRRPGDEARPPVMLVHAQLTSPRSRGFGSGAAGSGVEPAKISSTAPRPARGVAARRDPSDDAGRATGQAAVLATPRAPVDRASGGGARFLQRCSPGVRFSVAAVHLEQGVDQAAAASWRISPCGLEWWVTSKSARGPPDQFSPAAEERPHIRQTRGSVPVILCLARSRRTSESGAAGRTFAHR
jgi:hypothetical protein